MSGRDDALRGGHPKGAEFQDILFALIFVALIQLGMFVVKICSHRELNLSYIRKYERGIESSEVDSGQDTF